MTNTVHQTQPHNGGDALGDDTLSALLDGELSGEMAHATLKRLNASTAERTRYAEYCAVGDALRGLPQASSDLTQRIMGALQSEPTVLAPLRKTPDRRPVLWLAAAATAAITWSLWSAAPHEQTAAPMAENQPTNQQANIAPYLAAHQDFAQAVVAASELNYTRVSLNEVRP